MLSFRMDVFGAVTVDNPALRSSSEFTYTVYEFEAKQDYETTVGNLEPFK